MNDEDALVARAVKLVLADVAKAVDEIVARLAKGGRLFYTGTGTSGRLGVLDASECPPTFGVSPELVQGVIAGGYDACHRAVEASEDDANAGGEDLRQRGFTSGRCFSWNRGFGSDSLYCRRCYLGAIDWSIHCRPDVCSWIADHEGGGVEHCSRCWTRSTYRVEQAQGRHGAKDGSEHDLDGDDGPSRIRERQPHVESASAEHEAARACSSDRECGNRLGPRRSTESSRSIQLVS